VRVRSIVPAATYVRFERGAIVVDRRWNIDLLAARIDSYLPTASQLEGRIAGEELRAALDHAMRAITESFAHRAAETGRALTADPVALRAELSSLRGSLIRVLTAMTPQPEAPSSGWLDTVAGPEGALEGLRALLRWARAERASGAIAALQFRATGASVRRSLLG
jgi:hypothetical protein